MIVDNVKISANYSWQNKNQYCKDMLKHTT